MNWRALNLDTSKVLEETTMLPICQGDNLVDGKKDDLLKVEIVLSKYSTPDYPWIEFYLYVPGLLVMPAPLPNKRAGIYTYQANK